MKSFFFSALCCFFFPNLVHTVGWTILNYIEADNNIGRYGVDNVKAMQRVGSNTNVNIVVQLDEVSYKKTWRFKVKKGGKSDDVSLSQDMGLNPEKELPESVLWASQTYPSDYFMLILWNHGNGIVDEPKGYNRKIKRGILYDYANNTYLNNQQLKRALSVIHNNILGKKIDVLGCDACLMSMLEVCYQVKDHAKILIASENVEPAPGWDYQTFLTRLATSTGNVQPEDLARFIVESYDLFVKKIGKNYSLSAIKLDAAEAVKINLDNIVYVFKAMAEIDPLIVRELVQKARVKSAEVYEGRYIDLISFYRNLAIALSHNDKSRRPILKQRYDELISLLSAGEQLIKQAVFLHSSNRENGPLYGLSIYYPRSNYIHPSYPLTLFAQQSSWLLFIKEYPVMSKK